jgi:hypothetical protein
VIDPIKKADPLVRPLVVEMLVDAPKNPRCDEVVGAAPNGLRDSC